MSVLELQKHSWSSPKKTSQTYIWEANIYILSFERMLLGSVLSAIGLSLFSSPSLAAPLVEAGIISNIVGSLDQLKLNIEEFQENHHDIEDAELPSIFAENPELFKLHKQLVTISSVSGREDAVAGFLKGYLKNLGLGFELMLDETGKDIYAYAGNSPNSSVLLSSHIDTVPPFFDYSIKEESGEINIYGRGSCDAKGSVAAQIIAAKELLEEGLVTPEDISLLFVFGEEVGGGGMRAANKILVEENINWDTVIFGEPTENKLATGHKGIYLADVEVKGFASHSGYPEVGVDADKILIEIMHELENYEWPSSKLLNKTTLNIGLINGGPAANVVSPHAKCTLLMRTAVNASEIIPIVEEIVKKYEPLSRGITLKVNAADDPVSLDYDVEGFETYIASYATDIPNLTQRGFTRYLYGPGSILVAHGAGEYVSAKSLLKAVEDYKKLTLQSLGK